jgi:hypothetical protein
MSRSSSDTCGVFDEIVFSSANAAREALDRNGFRRFAENADLQSFLRPPVSAVPPIHAPQWPDLFVRALLAIMSEAEFPSGAQS